MGRHSRKGRAKAGPVPESAGRTAPGGDVPPSYGPSPDEPYGSVFGEASYETASIYRTGGHYAAEAHGADGYEPRGYDPQGYDTVADEPSVFERPPQPPSYATQRPGHGPGAPASAGAPAGFRAASPSAPPSASAPDPSSASGADAPFRYGRPAAARGGHPEQREPGGAWGAGHPGGAADGLGEAGRVLQARSGNFGQHPEKIPGAAPDGRYPGPQAGRSAGPRREDTEVVERDMFGGPRGVQRGVQRGAPRDAPRGAPQAPSPGAGSRAAGAAEAPSPSSFSSPASPSSPSSSPSDSSSLSASSPSASSSSAPAGGPRGDVRTPLPRYGDSAAGRSPAGDVRPDSREAPGRSLIDPGPAPLRGPRTPRTAAGGRQFLEGSATTAFPRGHARTDRERATVPDVSGGAAPPRVPAQGMGAGLRNSGPAGRAFTGVLAVAVATVLAFVVAGQLTSDVTEDGKNPQARGLGAGEPAPRTAKDGGAEAEAPGAPSYDVKMARTYPLRPELKGQGDFTAVSGGEKGAGGGTVLRYRVDVEKGLPLDSTLFARAVHKTLNDKRSWAGDGKRSFERVAKGDVDFVITLASSPTTDEWCAKSGLDTSEQNVSCDSASTDRVMINAYRWAQGSKTFGDDRIFGYRQMLINHEVGHRIGLDHVGCPKDGALAPVMMQQTKSLESDGRKCRPNPWVRPDA